MALKLDIVRLKDQKIVFKEQSNSRASIALVKTRYSNKTFTSTSVTSNKLQMEQLYLRLVSYTMILNPNPFHSLYAFHQAHSTIMALEFTLAILKPDFLRSKHNLASIEGALRRKGLEVVAKKDFSKWPEANVERFYGEHRGRFFYPRLVHYMGTGPISAVILKGPKAVSAWRELIGPTHLKSARKTKDCLRGEFAISDTKNSFHGSDSLPNAKEEILQFFPDIDFSTILEPSTNLHPHTAEGTTTCLRSKLLSRNRL